MKPANDTSEPARMKERASELLDLAQNAIFVQNLEGRISYWNQGAQRLYGWAPAEAVGRDLRVLAMAEDALLQASQAQTLKDGAWSGEMDKRTRDGQPVSVLGWWTLLRDAAGRPEAILVVETDITAQKKLEAQFLRAQRMEAIGALASGIAHDLNNVLAPILLSLEMLKTRLNGDQDRQLLATMQTCALRGTALIRQVLSFVRGGLDHRVTINLKHLVRDIHGIIRETFPKNIECQCRAANSLWLVTGDPTQLHQVIMNLCVNARDAMPQGGQLTLELQNVELDELQASMNAEGRTGAFVLLVVADTGVGIPPELQSRIFEPFFTTKQSAWATGLGLSTSDAIVRGHGGFISVSSKPGSGTRFEVYLPADTAAHGAEQAGAEMAACSRGQGELVLVVDDEKCLRSALQATLENHGYRVLVAVHGAEAVALYAQHREEIAAVLMDMVMPVMDGPAAIAALKTMNPQVKIIGSSGQGEEADKAKLAGVLHFVAKPYDAPTILKLLAWVLRDSHAHRLPLPRSEAGQSDAAAGPPATAGD